VPQSGGRAQVEGRHSAARATALLGDARIDEVSLNADKDICYKWVGSCEGLT
jgi:hypothetical protein